MAISMDPQAIIDNIDQHFLIKPTSIGKRAPFGCAYHRMTLQATNLMQKFTAAKGAIGQDDELVMLAQTTGQSSNHAQC